ncbi:MAG: preprotein translocase subunit SecE [Erysipelotrichaceae bacterium]|nr:preprotein translocase subunit SecE [Erysipelotrichaceae bacterium]
MGKTKKYLQGVVKEGKRVRWPSRETVLKSLGVVLVISIIAALWLSLDDFIAGKLLQILRDTFSK